MKLKEFRQKNGMTQEDVAKALGIPKKTYQNYEREVREADFSVLCALADLYEVTLDELMGRRAVSPGKLHALVAEAERQQDELIGIFQGLSTEGRTVLMAIANTLSDLYSKDDSDGR